MSLSRRLTTVDAGFLYFERPHQPQHVGGCLLYEGYLSRDELMQALAQRLHLLPRYRQRLIASPFAIAHPTWEDDPDFDIRNHVTEVTLPPPGDDQVLSEVGGRVFAPMLDRDRPLWQMTLLHGRADGATALIWKVHHAMVDGVSAVDLAMTLHDLTPDAAPPPPATPWQPRPLPEPLTLLHDAVQDQLTAAARRWADDTFRAWGWAETSGPGAPIASGFGDAVPGTLPPELPPAPHMPFNGPLSGERELAWAEFELAEVCRTKSVLGGTVNDVVLAVIAGGLGRYLRRHGYQTDGVVLRAQCPVSMRRPHERGALGNRVTSMIVPLYVGILDPVERLAAERTAMEELKRQNHADYLYALGELADRIPPAWQALAGQWPWPEAAAQPAVHTVSSNIPGPQIPLYLNGRRLLAMRLFGPLGGSVGLFNAIVSYDTQLTIGVLVDPTLMPDPWVYVECLQAAYDELHAAAAS